MRRLLAFLSGILILTPVTFAQNSDSAAAPVITISRSVTAVSYSAKNGTVNIEFQSTDLLRQAKGKAKVQVKNGIEIDTQFSNLVPASRFGSVYLTYVLWAISPEGRSSNLGELQLNGSNSKLSVTTRMQSFAMIVTAEPYFSVSFPSEMVVLANVVPPGTRGTFQQVQPKGELFMRGQYDNSNMTPLMADPKAPLALLEAENAIRIAQAGGANQYAADTFTKAQNSLSYAQGLYNQKKDKKLVISNARDAVQTAEDARIIAAKKIEQDKIAAEQAAAAAKTAEANAQAQAEAQKAAEAQAQAAIDAAKAAEAQAAKAQAELAASQAEQQRMAAQLQQQQAEAQAAQAQQQAAAAQDAAAKAEQEKEALRQQILQQLNQVLATVDTPRGLVVTMADVLFQSGKYDLQTSAREKLAKLSGIILSHPGLNLQIQGYTDNVGSDSFNMTLSEKRAEAVRNFLIGQGLSPDTITAEGLGKADPVASNDSAVGRQQNRRVEIIVSGDVIGVGPAGASTPQ
jgi:outer membrane protein OmpA-like peptidoglycan-associated protein